MKRRMGTKLGVAKDGRRVVIPAIGREKFRSWFKDVSGVEYTESRNKKLCDVAMIADGKARKCVYLHGNFSLSRFY